jgi:flagellar biosynthetic protein FliQ
MTIETAIDLLRNAMLTALLIVAPILVIGMVIGLCISLAQTITQIQEQTLSFVPRLVAMGTAIVIVMPWMFSHLLEYARALWSNLP